MWSTASCRGTLTEGFSADQFAVGDTAWRSGRGSEPLAGSGAGEWWMIKKSNLERIPALLVFSSGSLKPPFTNDWCWPGPGFPWGRRKLTLPGQAIEPKVSSLARPRIHSPGHKEPFANDRSCNFQFRWIAKLRLGRSQQVVMFQA